MDADKIGQLTGQLLVVLLFGLLVGYVARRAARSAPRSRRLVGYAVACGLLVLPGLGLVSVARGSGGTAVFIAAGVGMVLAGVAGVVLVFAARAARKIDGGSGGASGPLAVLLGLFAVFMGCGMVAFPFVYAVRERGDSRDTAYTARVESHGFDVTLPSDGWKRVEKRGPIADFYSRIPTMIGGVRSVDPDTTAGTFEARVTYFERQFRSDPAQKVLAEVRGENDHGQPMWFGLAEESGKGQRILVGVSVTWLNRSKVVVMMLEGQYENRSQVGIERERDVFRSAAERFLRSVR